MGVGSIVGGDGEIIMIRWKTLWKRLWKMVSGSCIHFFSSYEMLAIDKPDICIS